MMKTLVVFFSATGNTRKVGEIIAKALKADVDEITLTKPIDVEKEAGKMALGSLFGKVPEINEAKKNPSEYDLLVLGGQPWVFNLSPPIKAYILKNRGKFPEKMAFFITCGGMREKSAMGQMAGLSGRTPWATLIVKQKEIESGEYGKKVEGFVSELKK